MLHTSHAVEYLGGLAFLGAQILAFTRMARAPVLHEVRLRLVEGTATVTKGGHSRTFSITLDPHRAMARAVVRIDEVELWVVETADLATLEYIRAGMNADLATLRAHGWT